MNPQTGNGISLFVVETGLTVMGLLVAWAWPGIGARSISRVESFLLRLARRRRLAVLSVGLSALVLRLAILPIAPIPQPWIHDEFSYLLAADTFASGRLTNPTHPLWRYFESFHITHLPTYMSMYFPAQGLVLAAGQVLFGHPWYGVCLSAAAMCAAICWALQGWVPPGWALAGGALAVLRLGLFSYWVNSYYGGAVPAMGGALVLGAAARMLPKHRAGEYRARDGVIMALGAIILGMSRPYEGLLVCAPAAVIAVHAIVSSRRLRYALLPGAMLAAAAACLGYYDYRVFGNPFTLPYEVNRSTYALAPVFVWQQPQPEPVYRYREMRDFYVNWEMKDYREARTLSGFLNRTAQKAGTVVFFLFGVALFPPLVLLHRVSRDRRVRYLMVAFVVLSLGLALNVWLFPHYIAPFTAGFYVIVVQAMRHLCRGSGEFGKALVRITVLVCLVSAGLRVAAAPLHLTTPRWPSMWYGTETFGRARAEIAAKLESLPEGQLAIVRYRAGHVPFDDWVYNAADIDGSHVVWARDQGERNDGPLLSYYRERRVWLVEPDAVPPGLSPWPGK